MYRKVIGQSVDGLIEYYGEITNYKYRFTQHLNGKFLSSRSQCLEGGSGI